MTTSTDTPTRRETNCSFCNKSNAQVKKLIAGPGVYICDECVGLCNGILEDPGAVEAAEAVKRYENRDAEQIMEGLPGLARNAAAVESNLRRWVLRLRELGIDWPAIAERLGVAAEDAQARFGKATGPFHWPVVGGEASPDQ